MALSAVELASACMCLIGSDPSPASGPMLALSEAGPHELWLRGRGFTPPFNTDVSGNTRVNMLQPILQQASCSWGYLWCRSRPLGGPALILVLV